MKTYKDEKGEYINVLEINNFNFENLKYWLIITLIGIGLAILFFA